jgi:hypothetical protein
MTKIILGLAFTATVLFGVPASAQNPTLEPQKQGDVTFVSGGIGQDEQQALNQMQNRYNLRLLFAVERSGEYLADVPVRIRNQRGLTILDVVSRGPRLLVQVPPGSYQVSAELGGRPISETVRVPAKGTANAAFYGPAS